VATNNIILTLTAVGMSTCYVISARNEERLLLAGIRGAEYADRQRKTWRMIPFVY
jgi:protein-S-isoprenylcysteine O-methyltransferase Ste14